MFLFDMAKFGARRYAGFVPDKVTIPLLKGVSDQHAGAVVDSRVPNLPSKA